MPQRTLICQVLLLAALFGWTVDSHAATTPNGTPEAVIQDLYDLVTFPGDAPPDWDKARAMFIDEAVVILRTSKDGNTIFSVEGWIDDFVTFIDNSVAKEKGFSETIIKMESVSMGDIANVWVRYESKLPGSPGREGVDNFSMVRRDGRWFIASIVNELPRWGNEVPALLR